MNFEVSTAQKLADVGFYVIVYDRRGEGRSIDTGAKYNFQESINDINNLIEEFPDRKITLLGHSFGGILACKYAEKHPDKVDNIILIGAPVSLQESFKNIISKCREIYKEKNDTINLKYINMLQDIDPSSIEYSSYCFSHAMQNNFYTPKNMTQEARGLYMLMSYNPDFMKYGMQMTKKAPIGFWKNEQYTTINLTESIVNLQKKGIKFIGIYGKEDGLYSEKQIEDLANLIGKENLHYLENCSHSVFIDQQKEFMEILNSLE